MLSLLRKRIVSSRQPKAVFQGLTQAGFLIGLLLFVSCRPSEDRFLEEVIVNYTHNGFLHATLFQQNCAQDIRFASWDLKTARSENKKAAIKECRLLMAYYFLAFAHYNRQRLKSGLNARSIPENYKLNDLRLVRKFAEPLKTSFRPLLKRSYIAREEYSNRGGINMTMRVFNPNLVDRIVELYTETIYSNKTLAELRKRLSVALKLEKK